MLAHISTEPRDLVLVRSDRSWSSQSYHGNIVFRFTVKFSHNVYTVARSKTSSLKLSSCDALELDDSSKNVIFYIL